MRTPPPNKSPGLTRRRFMQSTLLAGGLGFGLGDFLRLRAQATQPGRSQPDTAVIQIWLGGGPSQFETFDPKPDAEVEFRGPYQPIRTRLPGVLFCEKLPRLAALADRAAIIRSVTHTTYDHMTGALWCSTGYPTTNATILHPSSGSVAANFRGNRHSGLPAYVQLSEEQTRNPELARVMGSGHLGARPSPFTILQDPFVNEYQADKVAAAVANLRLADDVTLARTQDRTTLLASLDRTRRAADALQEFDHFHRQALDMVTSGAARRAFDLNQEPLAVRRRYGEHRWGQMGLLARRLVETGTTFVTLNTAPDSLCWDWHRHIVNDNRPADGSDGPTRGMDISGPPLDQMISALVEDIYQRGLDRKVLLVVWGEFGRTPRVNATGGRDHWGALMSILLAGGGLRVGQVVGASSSKGETPRDRPVSPTEVLATIYRHLGIDPRGHTEDRSGRPFAILPDGEPIRELI
ncbi:MAG: DUF1501 domain-containing protein [Gemmataceae bacterium]|nr:DUF1501 domain-containing protein [Gemmataceae bacterium]